ncbi:ABC transporter permease [Candidatus Saccharibacteria bacterium]|nr:ABC transporter permease [Candidatus Saccharibacteria bacterium]
MRILSKLTIASVKRNKKRSIVTMIGVALSVALIFTVVAIPMSAMNTLKNYQLETYGDFHYAFESVPGDKLSIVENFQNVESYYYSEPVKFDKDDIFLDGSSAPYPKSYYTRIDSLSEADRAADKNWTIYLRFNTAKIKYHERYGKDIDYALSDAGVYSNMRVNRSLLSFDGDIDYNTATIMASLAALFIGSLVIASIFTIRNSFNISTTERTREFGVLSSIGATPRQIRRSVVFEAFIIGLFAIPVGLLLGTIAAVILLLITNSLLGITEYSLALYMPWWAVLADAVLGFVIVWLSSASAAIRASRLSPIEAIRSSQDIKTKNKKLKTNRLIQSYFGVGGVIASKNLKRSRQKYRTTVISLVVSVAVFVGLSSFVIDGQRIVDMYYPDMGADYTVQNGTPEQYRDLAKRFDIDDFVYYQDVRATNGASMTMLSREYFEKFARAAGVTSDFDRAVILNDTVTIDHANGAKTIERVTDLNAGDEATVIMTRADESGADKIVFTLAGITDKKPMGTSELVYPTFFVSEDYYNRSKLNLAEGMTPMFMNPGDKASDVSEYLTSLLKDKYFDIVNRENNEDLEEISETKIMFGLDLKEQLKQINNILLLLAIFMYGFIVVVALIGVTNVFNTISTNIILRAKEFAILKSVGMTEDEFNRMVRFESVLYSVRALLIGLPIGLVISYGTHYMLSQGGIGLSYQIPFLPIIIAVVAVALLISVIMRYSVRQVSRQNIIETIRQDNI